MVRHSSNTSELWKRFPWKKFRRTLFRLQRRVYKAVCAGDIRKARNLQKLILKSQAARLLAIRQVTQLNAGKKTPGIDGKTVLNFAERLHLNELLKQNSSTWKHQKLREIPIPKKDGTTRMLKVPTIATLPFPSLENPKVAGRVAYYKQQFYNRRSPPFGLSQVCWPCSIVECCIAPMGSRC
jgi:RNA-directed DNA polymerase